MTVNVREGYKELKWTHSAEEVMFLLPFVCLVAA